MTKITGRTPPVAVSFDSRGKRSVRFFNDAFAARRFFVKQHGSGREPEVHKALWCIGLDCNCNECFEQVAIVRSTDDGRIVTMGYDGVKVILEPRALYATREDAVNAAKRGAR